MSSLGVCPKSELSPLTTFNQYSSQCQRLRKGKLRYQRCASESAIVRADRGLRRYDVHEVPERRTGMDIG